MEYRKLEDMCRDVANIIRIGEKDLSIAYSPKSCEVHFDLKDDGEGGAHLGTSQKVRFTFGENTKSLYDLLMALYAVMSFRHGISVARGMDGAKYLIRVMVLQRCIDEVFKDPEIKSFYLSVLARDSKWAEKEKERYRDCVGGLLGIE